MPGGARRHNSMIAGERNHLPNWLQTISGVIQRTDNRLWYIGIAATQAAPGYGEPQVAAFRRLVFHINAALRINHSAPAAASMRKTINSCLDRLSVGIAIVSENRRVIRINRAAAAILEDGGGLRLANGQIEAVNRHDHRHLCDIVARVGDRKNGESRQGEALYIARTASVKPLAVVVSPLAAPDVSAGADNPAAAIFISDPTRLAATNTKNLRRIYDLTPTEARMAAYIAAGCSIDISAKEMGVTRQTARTHLKRVFSKTGASRQGELVSLLLSGPASIHLD